MSHAPRADKLLIKPAAGARPAPPRTRGQLIPKARTKRPVTRRVTHDTATTRLASAPDRPTRRVLPSPERARLAAARMNPARGCRACRFRTSGGFGYAATWKCTVELPERPLRVAVTVMKPCRGCARTSHEYRKSPWASAVAAKSLVPPPLPKWR